MRIRIANPKISIYRIKNVGGLFVIATFLVTISFLFTTPGVWKMVNGVPVTDFFVLKDLIMLGFGGIIMADIEKNSQKKYTFT